MWSNNRPGFFGILLAAAVLTITSAPGAQGDELAVSAKQQKICEKAEARYQKLYGPRKAGDPLIVKLYKYTFCPRNVTVKPGTTVRWVNVDKRTSHSVWLKEAGEEESERFFPEEQWEFTFISAGKYPYLCGPHWDQEGMTGFVRVAP